MRPGSGLQEVALLLLRLKRLLSTPPAIAIAASPLELKPWQWSATYSDDACGFAILVRGVQVVGPETLFAEWNIVFKYMRSL